MSRRSLHTGTLSVDAFAADVWIQEKNVVRVTDTGATRVSLCFPNITTSVASYTLDSSHKVTIDLTDFIRANGTQQNVFVRSNSGATAYVNIGYSVKGLINPKNVLIPDCGVEDFLIAPPRMIIRNDDFDPLCEVYVDASNSNSYYIGNDEIPRKNALVQVEILGDFHIDNRDEQKELARYRLREKVCGRKYAIVKWLSAFGTQKAFTWEVVQSSTKTGSVVELMTADGSFNTLKGRTDSLVLSLEDLNAYDYWYYADVCHSSKVEVSLDGGNTFTQVDVSSDSVTIPDGDSGEFNNLKVQVKFKEYDAVAL